MKQTKHTPGPWTVEPINSGKDILITSQKIHIAKVVRHGMMVEQTEKANARLIAAAPDLLAALRTVRAELELQSVVGGSDGLNLMVLLAIAKAKGN